MQMSEVAHNPERPNNKNSNDGECKREDKEVPTCVASSSQVEKENELHNQLGEGREDDTGSTKATERWCYPKRNKREGDRQKKAD